MEANSQPSKKKRRKGITKKTNTSKLPASKQLETTSLSIGSYTIFPVVGVGGVARHLYLKLHNDKNSTGTTKLFVANVHENTTQADLERLFACFGTVSAVEFGSLKPSTFGSTRFARIGFENTTDLSSKILQLAADGMPQEVAENPIIEEGLASLIIWLGFLFIHVCP
jgi:hypothetical protein